MAYDDLNNTHNPTTGQVIPAAWGDQIRTNQEFFIDPPACSVFASAAGTVAHNTATVMDCDSETFDNDAMHSTSTNPSRITIQTAGRYLLLLQVNFQADTDDTLRRIQFRKNGSSTIQEQNLPSVQDVGQPTTIGMAGVHVLSASDYVEPRVFQLSGSTLDVTIDRFEATFFTR